MVYSMVRYMVQLWYYGTLLEKAVSVYITCGTLTVFSNFVML